jgi:hypothetical protein
VPCWAGASGGVTAEDAGVAVGDGGCSIDGKGSGECWWFGKGWSLPMSSWASLRASRRAFACRSGSFVSSLSYFLPAR